MKTVILTGRLGTRISEESYLKPKPILWHIMKLYSFYGFNDFVICLGYRGYIIKEYFADYYLHMSDVTFDFANGVFDVAVDVREGSPTFGRYAAAELTPENGRMLLVPQGFAHGYMTLCGDTDVLYFVSEFYAPGSERGYRFDDPAFSIAWPARGGPGALREGRVVAVPAVDAGTV
ncbi:dTDP-4-dehydrorhamnose 3,5-epimerase family protein [Caproiciproducens sp. NJN-50]|uniref:dTDP-4-dehydrorhamnose 3,5-epimerase family protein n=1 Tax=Caproiciproducens sp. NJN-50 TaxID=2507162 RepID=UPI003FA4B827